MDLDRNTSDAGNAAATLPAGGLSRRAFIKAGAAAGGGLLLSIGLRAAAADTNSFAPNAFVRIDRDGRVTLIVCQVEMGQGIVGETVLRKRIKSHPAERTLAMLTQECPTLRLEHVIQDEIPDVRRSRRTGAATKRELILVLKNGAGAPS